MPCHCATKEGSITVGFLSSGSIGTVVHNLWFIRSSTGLYPISVGVVLYAKIAKYIIIFFLHQILYCLDRPLCLTIRLQEIWAAGYVIKAVWLSKLFESFRGVLRTIIGDYSFWYPLSCKSWFCVENVFICCGISQFSLPYNENNSQQWVNMWIYSTQKGHCPLSAMEVLASLKGWVALPFGFGVCNILYSFWPILLTVLTVLATTLID